MNTPDHLSHQGVPLEYRTDAANAALRYANSLIQSAIAAYTHEKLNTEVNRRNSDQKLNFARDGFIAAYMDEKEALEALNAHANRIASVRLRRE